jgi:NAD(P)-dependent dehydrogenase (short-subunit alcohol dehydrogenase family)
MAGTYNGKTVVVVGGSGFLGWAVVQAYHQAGAKLVVADRVRNAECVDSDTMLFKQMNVLEESSVAGFFAGLESLDAVVNVVGGYAAGQPVSELDLDVWDSQMNLNLKTAFLINKHAIKAMSAKGGGSIVNIASRAAVDKGVNSAAYSISKLGVLRLVEAAAEEAKNHDVRVNAVMPSIIDTPANRKAMPDAKYDKWPKPEQIAKVIMFLTSPDAELISGAAIPVYGKA